MTMGTTATGRDYIRQAQAEGLALFEAGAVEIIGGAVALVEEGGVRYGADAKGCGCSPTEDRGGHACSHQWGFYFGSTAADGFDRETAA